MLTDWPTIALVRVSDCGPVKMLSLGSERKNHMLLTLIAAIITILVLIQPDDVEFEDGIHFDER